MRNQLLEGIVESSPRVTGNKLYNTLDIYPAGTTALYCHLYPNCVHHSIFDGVEPLNPIGRPKVFEPFNPIKPEPVWNPNPVRFESPLKVEPFKPGMGLEGGLNLYGNRNTAILHDRDTGLDIHHHKKGGGALYYEQDKIDIFPWKKDKK